MLWIVILLICCICSSAAGGGGWWYYKNNINYVPEGCIAWYDAKSWDDTNKKWMDKSGSKNDISDVTGAIVKATDEISGGLETSMTLPMTLLGTEPYTLIHVTKAIGGSGKLVASTEGNYTSGPRGGAVVQSNFGTLCKETAVTGTPWIMTTEYGSSAGGYNSRMNGIAQCSTTGTGAQGPKGKLFINGQTIASSTDIAASRTQWAMREFIYFNRILTLQEIERLEKILKKKYKM